MTLLQIRGNNFCETQCTIELMKNHLLAVHQSCVASYEKSYMRVLGQMVELELAGNVKLQNQEYNQFLNTFPELEEVVLLLHL